MEKEKKKPNFHEIHAQNLPKKLAGLKKEKEFIVAQMEAVNTKIEAIEAEIKLYNLKKSRKRVSKAKK